ncbi:MAG: peptide/nickel transport system substrate-binding protein [Gaiellales bacterium]|jgi:peptide/nickel transport system substrate-binding protein|nr:peptide/nickel transport system substrate-binding protein [Gaiellales bacterium]
MTDYRKLDPIRAKAQPLQLDLIETYAKGRINRRDFIRRGTVLGLSMGTLAWVVSACGGGSSGTGTAQTGVGGGGGSGGAVQKGGTLRIASIAPANPLDPVAMIDLASYAIVAQSYEFLTYSLGDLRLTEGLAEKYVPNDDGSVWTFTIRQGVKWQDGSPFTTDDIIQTFERMVAAGNSGLKGVIESGSITAPDESTVVFTLTSPNGNFPYLVSSDNPQTVITPAAFTAGSLVDQSPNGTGPWKMESYNQATGATFVPNPDWWGGPTNLDTVEWQFFQDLQPQVVALQSGQADAIVQFSVLGGEGLLNNADMNVIRLQSAAHKEVWMRVDKGQFTDKRVRQAMGLVIDREAIKQSLFKGYADIGSDHPFAPVYPYTDTSVTVTRDVDRAKALLADAGVSGLSATLHAVKLQEVPDLAVLIKNNAAEAGINLKVSVEDSGPFYGKSWCPAEPADPPCSGAEELGIVDYGHRGVPDVYLNAALSTGGAWNSAQWASAEFDQAFKDYQAAVGVDAQMAAAKKIEEICIDESSTLFPYFFNYLSAHSKSFSGIQVTAIGHMFLAKAGRVA